MAIENRKPSPKWLDGNTANRQNSKQSTKHERRLAERLGGKRYPGSGNKPWSRKSHRPLLKDGATRSDTYAHEDTDCGDLAAGGMHFEHKFTRAASLSIQRDWLEKVEEGAKRKLKDPGLIITFQDSEGKPITEYVAMPLAVYERLMRKAKAAT